MTTRFMLALVATLLGVASTPTPAAAGVPSTMSEVQTALRGLHQRVEVWLDKHDPAKDVPGAKKLCADGLRVLGDVARSKVLEREWLSEDTEALLGELDRSYRVSTLYTACEVAGELKRFEKLLENVFETWTRANRDAVGAVCGSLIALVDRHGADCAAKAAALKTFLAEPSSEILYRMPAGLACKTYLSDNLLTERCRDDAAVHAAWCDRVPKNPPATLTPDIASRCLRDPKYRPAPGRMRISECARMSRQVKSLWKDEMTARYGRQAVMLGKTPRLPMWDSKACKAQLGHDDFRCIMKAEKAQQMVGCKGAFRGQGVALLALPAAPERDAAPKKGR